jgi:hypothetical protein
MKDLNTEFSVRDRQNYTDCVLSRVDTVDLLLTEVHMRNHSSSARAKKLQYLLIAQLLEMGSVQLLLPDGMTLEVGITQLGKKGLKKTDDYCYVVASKDTKTAMIDSYNLALQFEKESNTIVYEDEILDDDGNRIGRMEIV